ncbi:MAG: T9SS type A sorting domain-containing protein, partial [Bacteroidales bacterium]|nr:T9SS type A sorting domain-containing protein [Bacteroidales bacterium]
NLNVEVNNEEWGHVEVDEGCGNATLRAVADNDCSDFWRWSDGNSDNPRVINVSSDTSLTAIFTDPVFDTTIHATIAQGETYLLNGQELSQSGVYSANVLSEAGCEIYLTLVLDVIATDNIGADYSSLSQTSLELLSLKPNPTKGLIEFGQRIDKVVVIDISGRRIESFFDANQINISHLPAGVYHLELQCGDETVVRKIVKE